MIGFPTVPPARPKLFFGLIGAYVLTLLAAFFMVPQYATPIAVVGFVVTVAAEFVVEWKATESVKKA